MRLCPYLLLLLSLPIAPSVCRQIKVLALLPANDSYLFSLSVVRPAVEFAVETVHRNSSLLRGHSLSVTFADSGCGNQALFNTLDFEKQHGRPDVIVGPVCVYAAAPVARLAKHWQVPMVTAGALAHGFADKRGGEYEYLTRVSPPYSKLGGLFLAMFRRFGWKSAVLLYHDDRMERDCYFTVEGIFAAMRNEVDIYVTDIFVTPHHNFSREVVEHIRMHSTVAVLCFEATAVHKIMLAAHRSGMTNGDYIFFNIELFNSTLYGDGRWNDFDAEARHAHRALRTITLLRYNSPEFDRFTIEMKQRSLEMFNFSYRDDNVNMFVEGFYNALLLYTQALHQAMLYEDHMPSGDEITRHMWNCTIAGIAGTVIIDANGDSEGDYSIIALTDTEKGTQKVIGNYYGHLAKFEETPGMEDWWPRNLSRKTTPQGVSDTSSMCQSYGLTYVKTVAIVIGTLLLCLILLGIFFFLRKYKVFIVKKKNWAEQSSENIIT
uniref:atrial natriuretic peptide receptor 3 n=1 Tax=Myxine glutinosa TaxID=7769 RepID=UPI00358E5F38